MRFLLDLLLNVGHTSGCLVILLFDGRFVFIWTRKTPVVIGVIPFLILFVILAIGILLLEVKFIVGVIVEPVVELIAVAILPTGVIIVDSRITITAVTVGVVV